MRHTFYKGDQELTTDNLAAFCKEHHLERRPMYEVISGKRARYKGYAMTREIAAAAPPPPINYGTIPVEDLWAMAEEVARQSPDPAYRKTVLDRVARARSGEPLPVPLDRMAEPGMDELRRHGLVK